MPDLFGIKGFFFDPPSAPRCRHRMSLWTLAHLYQTQSNLQSRQQYSHHQTLQCIFLWITVPRPTADPFSRYSPTRTSISSRPWQLHPFYWLPPSSQELSRAPSLPVFSKLAYHHWHQTTSSCRCQQSCTWPTSWVWSFYHTLSLQVGPVFALHLKLPAQPSIAQRSAGMFVNEISHRGYLQEDKRSLPSIKTTKGAFPFQHLMLTQLSCEVVKGWRCFCIKRAIDLFIYIIYAVYIWRTRAWWEGSPFTRFWSERFAGTV